MHYPDLHLVSHKLCPYVQRARIVLAEKAVPHRLTFIDLAAKPDWFLRLSPLGKVPLLLVDGRPLFESAAIAEYVDEISPGSLLPAEPIERALNRAWIQFASSILDAVGALYRAPDDHSLERAATVLDGRFGQLEGVLGHGPFFNGADFSLVDAAFAPVFRYFDVIDRYVDFGLFDHRPRLGAWRGALAGRSAVRAAVVADYPERLEHFLIERNSRLSDHILNVELRWASRISRTDRRAAV